jgi:deoxyribonuclease-4
MRVGILAFTIGELGIIVPVIPVGRHNLVEKGLHIFEQSILPFVQENSSRRMQRLQVDNAFANAALPDDLVDAVGYIDQFHPVLRDPVQNTMVDPVIPGLGYRPSVLCIDSLPFGRRGFGEQAYFALTHEMEPPFGCHDAPQEANDSELGETPVLRVLCGTLRPLEPVFANTKLQFRPCAATRKTSRAAAETQYPYAGILRIGIHCSTAGSLERAAKKATELGANTFQIFSASPRMWRAKPPVIQQVRLLKAERDAHDLTPLVIHDNYLINLASGDPEIRTRSIDALTGEMERAIIIGSEFLVAHPGNYKGLSLEQGLLNVAEALPLAWRAVPAAIQKNAKLTLLLENTAGAGAQLGGVLSELQTIRQLAGPYIDIPIGYCLDTCHCWVAGFDVASETGLDAVIAQAEQTLGLGNVPVIHANDAKAQRGSHIDRHENIGAGYIGKEGFRRILNHPKLREKAFILETPVDNPGDDRRNVTALKELVFQNKRLTTRKSKASGTSGGRTRPSST